MLLERQICDLNHINDLQYSHYRISPIPLTSSLTKMTTSLINPSILGLDNISKGIILDLHEIIEGNIDESLVLMNESNLEEPKLRKVFFSFLHIFFKFLKITIFFKSYCAK